MIKRPQLPDQIGIDAHWEKTLQIIRCKGWAVQAVFGTGEQSPYAYSVGLSAKGLPEILVIGAPAILASNLINECAKAIIGGSLQVADRQPVTFLSKMPLALQLDDDVETMLAVMTAARRWGIETGHSVSAVQIMLPDPCGRFPWDHDCKPKYRDIQSAAKLLEFESALDDDPYELPRRAQADHLH
jgi:hypothetical protein